jgi:hypothetical protein
MPGAATFYKAALAFTFLAASSSAMAQGVGAIAGTLSDPSASVLPGITVALSNPGTIGGTQETVTDARGAYQFTRLVPGRYSVKATLTGFRSATQENVVVNADATARVDLQLEIGALEEGIIVKCQQSAAGGGSSPRTGNTYDTPVLFEQYYENHAMLPQADQADYLHGDKGLYCLTACWSVPPFWYNW